MPQEELLLLYLLPDREMRSVVGRETYYLFLTVAYAIFFAILRGGSVIQ